MNKELLEAMDLIANELQTLQAEAAELQSVYSSASAASDLTFIKILEQKYELLADEFRKLGDVVADARSGLAEYDMEGTSYGR